MSRRGQRDKVPREWTALCDRVMRVMRAELQRRQTRLPLASVMMFKQIEASVNGSRERAGKEEKEKK